MNILLAIDTLILALCTKFSHWLQRVTGRTNFFVAKIGFFVICLVVLVRIVNYWFPLLGYTEPLVMLFVYIILISIMTKLVYRCDDNEYRLYQGKTLYNITPSGYLYRMIWVFLSVADTVGLFFEFSVQIVLSGFFNWGSFITVYFLAVTPLPPGISKIQKMLEKLTAAFRKPVPAPIARRASLI